MRTLYRHPAVPALGGFLALAAALGVGRFVYTPILPYMVAGLGISKSEAGLIASANFIGYLLGALAAAGGRVPGARRSWLLGALAVSALSTGAMALATSLGPFLALRFVGGAASALVMVFASVLVLDRLSAMGRCEWAAMLYAGVGGGSRLTAGARLSYCLGRPRSARRQPGGLHHRKSGNHHRRRSDEDAEETRRGRDPQAGTDPT